MPAPCPIGIGRVWAAIAVAALVHVGWSVPSAHAADAFTVAGQVDGLYPGAAVTLDAIVTNPHPFAIRVSSVAVTVGDAGPSCPGTMLVVGDSAASVVVAARATGTVPLEIRMQRSAPDACQGATWPLLFAADGIGPAATDLPATSLLDPARIQALVALGLGLVLVACAALLRKERRQGRAT